MEFPTVTFHGELIRLDFDYDPAIIQRVKQIPGRRYHPDGRFWTIPETQWLRFKELFEDVGFEVKGEDWWERIQWLEKSSFTPIGEVRGFRGELYPFQSVAVGFLVERRRCLMADDMGCLTGDALIHVNRNGKGFKIPLKKLYLRFNGLDSRYRWIKTPTYIRALKNGFFHLEEVAAVFHSGVKEVFEVSTEDDKVIKATGDHLFLTKGGWKPLSILQVGEDDLVTNGLGVCLRCGQTRPDIITYQYAKFKGFCRRCMYIFRKNSHFKTGEYLDSDGYILVSGLGRHPYARRQGILKHRVVYEAYLNNASYDEWLDTIKLGKWDENSVFLKPRDVVHHIDGDKLNNDISNLRLFSSPNLHMLAHSENMEHRFPIFHPKISRIKSITPCGKEEVFDIKTRGPAHNFVANGFVVHNCGKTVCAIAAALELRNRGKIKRMLIFCPKTIIRQWMGEIQRFTGGEEVAVVTGTRNQRQRIYDWCTTRPVFWVITNYETVLREGDKLAALKPDLTVLDEAQRIGNYSAKTTRQMKRLFKTPYRWGLTGTPLENALAEVHSIFDWIDPGILGPWWMFKRKYLIYGGFLNKQVIGHRNLPQLYGQIQRWMLRRRKSEVLKDLPPVTVNNYYVELSSEESGMYKKIRKELGKYYDWFRESRGEVGSGDVLGQLTYLRECCNGLELLRRSETFPIPIEEVGVSSKLRELTAILKDLGDAKIVIYSQFKKFLPLISAKLDSMRIPNVIFHGDLNIEERVRALEAFQKRSELRVFLSTEAGGLGVNLQCASTVINMELHWNPAKLKQRVNRLHRIGQPNTVTCINLIASHTIEEKMLRTVEKKTDLFRKIVDGDFSDPSFENEIFSILAEEFPRRQL